MNVPIIFFLFMLYVTPCLGLAGTIASTGKKNSHSVATSTPLKKQKIKDVWITVFIHGAFKAQLARCSFLKVMTDNVQNCYYERTIGYLRDDPFFWQTHAMQEPGFKKIEMAPAKATGASLIAQTYDAISKATQCPECINSYYTFGWSGLLSAKIRYQESQKLYEALLHEMKRISKEMSVTPKIRLVCFSHGGNVALGLAKVKNEIITPACLYIDELVLWGTPIQKETDYFVADKMFKKVYHFYSPADGIQTSDFFSFKRFFSNSKFHPRSIYPLPDSLTQISIKVMKYQLRPRFAQRLELLESPLTTTYPKGKIKKMKYAPGHIELWYLGWTPAWYRKSFPLYPLPVFVFTPYLISSIGKYPTLSKNIEITLHPQLELMDIKNKRTPHKIVQPFVSTALLNDIKKKAETAKPCCDMISEHKKRLKTALLWSKGTIPETPADQQKRLDRYKLPTFDEWFL